MSQGFDKLLNNVSPNSLMVRFGYKKPILDTELNEAQYLSLKRDWDYNCFNKKVNTLSSLKGSYFYAVTEKTTHDGNDSIKISLYLHGMAGDTISLIASGGVPFTFKLSNTTDTDILVGETYWDWELGTLTTAYVDVYLNGSISTVSPSPQDTDYDPSISGAIDSRTGVVTSKRIIVKLPLSSSESNVTVEDSSQLTFGGSGLDEPIDLIDGSISIKFCALSLKLALSSSGLTDSTIVYLPNKPSETEGHIRGNVVCSLVSANQIWLEWDETTPMGVSTKYFNNLAYSPESDMNKALVTCFKCSDGAFESDGVGATFFMTSSNSLNTYFANYIRKLDGMTQFSGWKRLIGSSDVIVKESKLYTDFNEIPPIEGFYTTTNSVVNGPALDTDVPFCVIVQKLSGDSSNGMFLMTALNSVDSYIYTRNIEVTTSESSYTNWINRGSDTTLSEEFDSLSERVSSLESDLDYLNDSLAEIVG